MSFTLPDSCQSTWYQLCPLGWSRCNRGNRCMAKCGTRKRWQHGGVLRTPSNPREFRLISVALLYRLPREKFRTSLTMLTAFFESACLLFWVLNKTWRQSHDTQEPNTQGLRAQAMSKLQQTDEMKQIWGESEFFGILCSIILVLTEIHAPKLWTCTQSCAN